MPPASFCFFENGCLYCPTWPGTCEPPASASRVASIRGPYHYARQEEYFNHSKRIFISKVITVLKERDEKIEQGRRNQGSQLGRKVIMKSFLHSVQRSFFCLMTQIPLQKKKKAIFSQRL
jgi:hypothetical protein